jgi:hypothetical protein
MRWGYGPIAGNKEKINTLLLAVKHLMNEVITGAELIAAFLEKRVLRLMRRARHLDKMVPNAPLEGTVLMTGELDHEEIKKHVK